MSYPKVLPDQATPETIKEMLDSGKHLYIPMPAGYELPVFRDKETGKYVFDAGAGERYEFEGTEEGLKQLVFFVAFSGTDYI